jgi:Kef-type K+ transport system membrane component KefB
MEFVTHYPLLVFVLTFPVMWLASLAGLLARRRARVDEKSEKQFDLIVAATLTLLALIIGFSFSMATSRYDQRKNLEAAEANAIGTEYLRADLLPAPDAASIHTLLDAYLDERIASYGDIDAQQRALVDQRTLQLQRALWAAVSAPAAVQRTGTAALAAAGMNEVLDSEGYVQAAIQNRIPEAAWALMVLIALCSNVLLGFGSQNPKLGGGLALVSPLLVAISFLLIADIDEPGHGLIQVDPVNLQSLARTLGR